MSVYAPGQSPYSGPTSRVNYGWIGESWNIFKRDAGIWIAAIAIYYAIYFVVEIPFQFSMGSSMQGAGSIAPGASPMAIFQKIPWGAFGVLELFMIVMSLFMTASLLTMALKAVRNMPLSFSDAFGGARYMGPIFVFGLLASLFNMLGLLALIIGVIFTTGLLLPGWAMIVDGEPVMSAFSRSIDAMKRDWVNAGGFVFIGWLAYFLGSAITCGFGVLVIGPMFAIVMALVYRDMVGMEGILSPNMAYGQNYPPQQPYGGVWPPPPGADQTPTFGQAPYGQNPYGQQPTPPQYPQQAPYGQQPQPYGQQPPVNPQYPPPAQPLYGQEPSQPENDPYNQPEAQNDPYNPPPAP